MFLTKKIIEQFFSPVSLSLEITVAGLILLYLTSKKRTGRTFVLNRMIPEGKLLLSGGSEPGTMSSAQDMAQLAREIGVNEKDIIIETKSRDTDDEAYIIHSMIGEESFVLVTSSVHMSRSMALFRKHGMNPVPAPTRSIEERLLYRTPAPFFPSSINLQKSEMAFHEYSGIIWAGLRSLI